MADATLADTLIPPPPNSDEFDPLSIPPLDPYIFSDDFNLSDNFISFPDDDFDITFDDIYDETDDLFDSTFLNNTHLSSDPESGSDRVSGDRVVNGYLNMDMDNPSSGSHQEQELCGGVDNNYSSPELGDQNHVSSSQGSGHGGSADSCDFANNSMVNEVVDQKDSSDSANNSIINDTMVNEVVVDQKVKVEEVGNGNGNVSLLKRKKGSGDSNSRSRTSKLRRSDGDNCATTNSSGVNDDDDEKKKARLIRNRESAQLSRQRKKHYVEELEDKVRSMHSTIHDLNAKISYIVAENASLRQQVGGNSAGGVCPPPPVMYPYPGMAPMPYPWMPCPPYVVKSQGSQVPLVPIPRLKPQQHASASKTKKVESKKSEGKTKKVASVSFLGLLFFIMLFGGLVPMVNVKYGGIRDAYSGMSGSSNYVDSRLYDKHHGRVLSVNSHVNGTNHNKETGFKEKFGAGIPCGKGHEERGSHHSPDPDEFKRNGSEPLVASLYVPRNDKLVKIDGNLIIHSVLASEKAMTSRQEMEMTTSKETGLAVALAPALPATGLGRSDRKHPRQRAIASDEEYAKSKAADGKLQQWFREGLAGPLLSSGMCTEVFQFDVSAASGAIIPATSSSIRNMTREGRSQNSTYLNNKVRNRRILHGLPIPLPPGSSSADNITKDEHSDRGGNSHRNSSMVVSVLVDPREAGDVDSDGVMGKKSSFPRIFVVVLLDSVKYVTYSCVLPLMGGSTHVVTT